AVAAEVGTLPDPPWPQKVQRSRYGPAAQCATHVVLAVTADQRNGLALPWSDLPRVTHELVQVVGDVPSDALASGPHIGDRPLEGTGGAGMAGGPADEADPGAERVGPVGHLPGRVGFEHVECAAWPRTLPFDEQPAPGGRSSGDHAVLTLPGRPGAAERFSHPR